MRELLQKYLCYALPVILSLIMIEVAIWLADYKIVSMIITAVCGGIILWYLYIKYSSVMEKRIKDDEEKRMMEDLIE